MDSVRIVSLFLWMMTVSVVANANICNSDWLAAAGGSDVDASVSAGMDPNQVCTIIRNRPLHQALLTPGVSPSVVEALIRNGARVDMRNSEGDTPFGLAEERFARVSENSPQYWREKAVYDAVMGSLETDRFTAATDAHNQLCDLNWWRSSASGPAVRRLLEIPGVDPDYRCNNASGDRIPQVPLRLTAFRIISADVFWGIKELVDAGTNVTIRNNSGESVLDMVERRYDLVVGRITRAQRRWCRGGDMDSVLDEAARNAPDTTAYLYITSVATGQDFDEVDNRELMELYGINRGEDVTQEVLCPYIGIPN